MPDSETPERCRCGHAKIVHYNRNTVCLVATCDCQAFSSDPLPIPSSDQERCGGSRVIAFPGASDVRNPRPCPGCPDCKPDKGES